MGSPRHPVVGSSALRNTDRFTYGDYRQWPEDKRWELIDGQAYSMSPAPRRVHQGLSRTLLTQLDRFFAGKPCTPYAAPIDVFWTNDPDEDLDAIDTVTQPDLLVVCDPVKLIDEGIKGAPDFIIEILSPSTAWKDQTEKRQLHEKFGVKEFWLVHPDTREVQIYLYDTLTGRFALPQSASLESAVPVTIFPGLTLRVAPDLR